MQDERQTGRFDDDFVERPLVWEVREPGAPARGRSDDPYELLRPRPQARRNIVAPPSGVRYDAVYMAATRQNWMAITAIVCALLIAAPLGVLFGHLALNAASRGEAQNPGVAVFALVVSYLTIAVGFIWLFL